MKPRTKKEEIQFLKRLFLYLVIFFAWISPLEATASLYSPVTPPPYYLVHREEKPAETRVLSLQKEIARIAKQYNVSPALPQMVVDTAKQYGVDPKLALFVIEHESHFNVNAVGDMHILCPGTNQPVRAKGLAQITSCYHPEVSDAEAFNAKTNVEIAMKLMSQGKTTCMNQFSTCKKYFSL